MVDPAEMASIKQNETESVSVNMVVILSYINPRPARRGEGGGYATSWGFSEKE